MWEPPKKSNSHIHHEVRLGYASDYWWKVLPASGAHVQTVRAGGTGHLSSQTPIGRSWPSGDCSERSQKLMPNAIVAHWNSTKLRWKLRKKEGKEKLEGTEDNMWLFGCWTWNGNQRERNVSRSLSSTQVRRQSSSPHDWVESLYMYTCMNNKAYSIHVCRLAVRFHQLGWPRRAQAITVLFYDLSILSLLRGRKWGDSHTRSEND